MLKLIALLASVTALALAGCGSDDKSSSDSGGGGYGGGGGKTTTKTTTTAAGGGAGGAGGTIPLAADPTGQLKFDTTKLEAKAGTVTIAFDNSSSVPHAVEVEGNGVEDKTAVITKSKADLKLDLKPGTYEFYCPVDGHKAAGMKGTLVVQ